MMPTKKRVAKQKMFDTKSPKPDYLANADRSVNQAAGNVGLYIGGLIVVDEAGEAYQHEEIGKGGNEMRRADRRDEVLRLQRKYSSIWGKRGAAKIIAIDEQLSDRTVQQYFKDFPME